MELELTGDELAAAQSVLLDSVQQLQILDDEITRLEVATEEGGIVRRKPDPETIRTAPHEVRD